LILSSLSALYGAAASWRRQWYARDPDRRRRLARPVISIGNLSVGGAGKTPIVAHVAQLLVESGERPAILTRGYGRVRRTDGVTVVSDGRAVVADLAHAGDEPLMLARQVSGVPVLVSANRYAAGLLAERQFGATVHVLDDGFQHLELSRTVDLLLVDENDLSDRPLPVGRLREPLASASAAAAVLVTSSAPGEADRIGATLGAQQVFRIVRTLGAPRALARGVAIAVPPGSRVFAVAAIARPARFFSDLAERAWQVVGSLAFRDHHPFSQRDVDRVAAAAKAVNAAIVLTTEKDAVRLEARDLHAMPIAAVPLTAAVDPLPAFRDWLLGRL
jgi:tetraacyldisaccharide 4'-kinase